MLWCQNQWGLGWVQDEGMLTSQVFNTWYPLIGGTSWKPERRLKESQLLGTANEGAGMILGTNISHPKAHLKMIFLFPRWDMLVSRRVIIVVLMFLCVKIIAFKCFKNLAYLPCSIYYIIKIIFFPFWRKNLKSTTDLGYQKPGGENELRLLPIWNSAGESTLEAKPSALTLNEMVMRKISFWEVN